MIEIAAPVARDAFVVWSEMVIPSIWGAGSVIVSVVAILTSRNASRLARAIDAQREKASKERADEVARERLLEMSVREGKLLRRWVFESRKPTFGFRGTPVGATPPPPSPLELAEAEARVELEHSLVPGAALILAITAFDIENRRRYVERGDEAGEWRLAVFDGIVERRDERTDSRLRAWALDPQAEAARFDHEYHVIQDDPMNYLFFGESIEDAV